MRAYWKIVLPALVLGLYFAVSPGAAVAGGVNTPATRAIEQRLRLDPVMRNWLVSGVVGMDQRGYLLIRRLHRAPQAQHARVRFLVSKDQRDRDAWMTIQRERGNLRPDRDLYEMTFKQLPRGSWYEDDKGWRIKD